MRTGRLGATATASVAALVMLAGCGGGGREVPDPLTADARFVGVAADVAPDEDMTAASVRLATALMDLGPAGEDVVVSPLSLQLALALLREGATGEAADAIDEVAGLAGSQAVADLRALLAEYDGDVAGIDPDDPPATPILHVADSAFVQRDVDVREDFLERVAAYHGADVLPVDFTGDDARPAMDAWVTEETGGLLTECPVTTDAGTRMVLMDAVTFGATWERQFPPAGTSDGEFTRADGVTVRVPFMHRTAPLPYAEGRGWVAVELAYSEGFVMRLVLPDRGTLTAEGWADVHRVLSSGRGAEIALHLPRWESESTVDLTGALGSLGLGSLATPGDLDGVFAGAYVETIAQGATITVAEKGTVAAAVTAVEVTDGAAAPPPLTLWFDRPFEYQVVHEGTGLVLFAGRVADPSAD